MKKTLLGLSLACAAAFSAENGFFVGINGGLANVTVSNDMLIDISGTGLYVDSDFENDKNALSFGYGLKFGYDFYLKDNQAIRTYIDYLRADFSGTGSYTTELSYDIITANADYRYHLNDDFSLFGGISLGSLMANSNGLYGDSSAFAYGINLGAIYELTSELELEGKFRYLDSNLAERVFADTTTGNNVKISPDDFYAFTIGLNFKF